MLTFDFFMARSNLLPHAFVWALYIYMGTMLRIHTLDIPSEIQTNGNLMMSIRVPSRHKTAKWADRKSKMATTAAILKINFQHLFKNLWSLWAETCSVAIGWLLDPNKLKLCWSEIQDGSNDSTPLNKMAPRAKNRKSSNDISSLANGPVSKYLHRSVPPKDLYQNFQTGSTWLNKMGARAKNRKKKKTLKDISSVSSVLISK